MIRCEINPRDKRKVDVYMTETGAKAHRTYRESRLALTITVLKQLADHDRTEFMRILGLMRSMFAKSLSKK
jgi:DNA-binding MarR family transcriptional regulator